MIDLQWNIRQSFQYIAYYVSIWRINGVLVIDVARAIVVLFIAASIMRFTWVTFISSIGSGIGVGIGREVINRLDSIIQSERSSKDD